MYFTSLGVVKGSANCSAATSLAFSVLLLRREFSAFPLPAFPPSPMVTKHDESRPPIFSRQLMSRGPLRVALSTPAPKVSRKSLKFLKFEDAESHLSTALHCAYWRIETVLSVAVETIGDRVSSPDHALSPLCSLTRTSSFESGQGVRFLPRSDK